MTDAAPTPSEQADRIAAVFDRAADTYGAAVNDFFAPAGRDLVVLAGLQPGGQVLDIGCGRGAVLFPAAHAVGTSGRVVGVDLAARMVELTTADAQRRGLTQVRVRRAAADDPLPDGGEAGGLHAVVAGFVLFFLPEPAPALRRYRSLLRDGGRLAFTTFGEPDASFEAAMEAIGAHIPRPVVPADDHEPVGVAQRPDRAVDHRDRGDRQGRLGSVEGITGLLHEAGYRDVRIEHRMYETVFDDFAQWTVWAWSHGGRATLERVPADALDAAYVAAEAALEPARSGERIVMRTGVRLSVATT